MSTHFRVKLRCFKLSHNAEFYKVNVLKTELFGTELCTIKVLQFMNVTSCVLQ